MNPPASALKTPAEKTSLSRPSAPYDQRNLRPNTVSFPSALPTLHQSLPLSRILFSLPHPYILYQGPRPSGVSSCPSVVPFKNPTYFSGYSSPFSAEGVIASGAFVVRYTWVGQFFLTSEQANTPWETMPLCPLGPLESALCVASSFPAGAAWLLPSMRGWGLVRSQGWGLNGPRGRLLTGISWNVFSFPETQR